jgi:hypothetical protein
VATAAVGQGSATSRGGERGGERWVPPTLSLAAVVVLAFAATALVASLADGRSATPRAAPSEPRPSALWHAFPLRVPRTEAPAAPVRVPRTKAPLLPPHTQRSAAPVDTSALTGVVRRDGSSRNVLPLAVGVAIVLLVAGGASFFLLRGPTQRWRRTATAAVSHGRAVDQLFTLTPMVPRSPDQPYLLIVPGRMGWGDRLVEREGELPMPGEVIVDDELGTNGQAYVVEDVEPSPLPEDTRPCAVLRAL